MSGFETNVINLIADNLRDRYDSGFPVLKELVQNANDARGATRFNFGHHPGFGLESKHPLITGPALWFFNDGDVTSDDIKNIRSFGINSKAGDASTIGKFGLGMKSVFHLVEAFLYVGKSHAGSFVRGIINPWDNKEPEHLHSDWDRVEDSDWNALEHLAIDQLTIDDSPSGFFLWLPLRTQALLNGKGPIIPCYPGEPDSHELDFLGDGDLAARLAAVLAMLPNLRRITYHRSSGGFDLETVTAPTQSRLALASDAVASTNPVYVIEGTSKPLQVAAKHFPATNEDEYFSKLKSSPAWPKSFLRNSEGNEKLASDKSRQEGAVVISHMDGVAGKLDVEWAVFLPLEAHAISIPIPNSSRHYRITLHGQFFVDAGRKGIFGFEDWFDHTVASPDVFDESSLRREWNKALVERVILPLLLPTLEHYCQAWALKDDEIENVTDGIGKWLSRMAQNKVASADLRRLVCQPGAWVRQLTNRDATWTLKDGLARLLPIPCPPKSDKARPWQIFPALDKLGAAIDVAAPVIAQTLALQWNEAETLACVQSINVTQCFTRVGLDYLADWLEMRTKGNETCLPYLETPDVQLALIKKIHEGLRQIGLNEARSFTKSFSRVLSSCRGEKCIGLGTRDKAASSAISETVFQALWSVESDQLLVPNDLLDQDTKAKPSQAYLPEWLKALQPLVTTEAHANAAMLAAQTLLESLDIDKRKEFLSLHKDLRVIRSRNVRTGKDEPMSLSALYELRENHALFATGMIGGRGAQPLKLLTDALPEQSLFQLTTEGQDAVFGAGQKLSSPDDSVAILTCVFNSESRIGTQKARKNLIDSLNIPSEPNNQDQRWDAPRLGMRYLVHGVLEHRHSEEPLWLRDENTHVAWQKLWAQLGETQDWQVVDVTIGGNLKPSDSKKLGIKKIDHHAVIEKMQRDKTGLDRIKAQDFTDDERVEILRTIDDQELWEQLPLHEFSSGVCACIESGVFRQGKIQIPSGLTSQVRFVVLSKDATLGQRQKEWIPELSHNGAAELALKSHNPSDYWKLILDAIEKPDHDLQKSITRLRESAWLPLANGQAVAPQNILHIEGMDDEIERLASEAGDQFATLANLQEDFKKHAVFARVKDDVLPKGKDAFEVILRVIDALPRYSVGVFPSGLSDLIKDALPALTPIASLPGWSLLAKASEQLDQSVGDLLSVRTMPQLDTDVAVKLLNELAQSAPSSHAHEFKAHLLYLHSLNLDLGCSPQHIAQLNLRAKDGSWNPAEALCAGVSGIALGCLLDEDQQHALRERVHIANLEVNEGARNDVEEVGLTMLLDTAEKIAQDYFGGLAKRAKGAAIGFLLAIMGDRYKVLAQNYLGNKYPVDDYVRKGLSGDSTDQNQSTQVLRESINTANVVFVPVKAAKVDAPNLLRKSKSFPLEKNPATLIVGTPTWVRHGEQSALKVLLASADTFSQLDSAELNLVLKKTTQELMLEIHHDKHDHVSALWQEINQSDQLELEIVKRKILDSLPLYLEQLGAHRSPPIKQKIEGLKKAQDRYYGADHRKEVQSVLEATQKEFRRCSDLLANCISEDTRAHQIVLEQMRRKLGEYQYEPDAVLFELFQNADDAAVQLARCESSGDDDFEIPEPAQRLVVQSDQNTIRIMHWGRLINYCPPGLPDKWQGFSDDLKKMLVLNSSDKSDDQSVTGRFGLGFKSVFLVCDRPRIISGDLKVEIQGSILPTPWKATDTALNLLDKHSTDRSYRGTLIELDITQGKSSNLLTRFEQHSGLLSVFSRALREIQIDTDGTSKVAAWRPNTITSTVEVGKTWLPSDPSGMSTLLVIRAKEGSTEEGSIALKLGPGGCVAMDAKVCPIWVTAPTRETDKIGFVVNGPFNIDAGRGRLAGSQAHNKAQLQKIGRHVGQRLSALCQATNEPPSWEKLRGDLGLVKECSMPVFWGTIWQVLSRHTITHADSELSKLVAELVSGAFTAWLETGIPFPNGLADMHADFVRPDSKFVQLDDSWNEPSVLKCLSDLRKLQPTDYVVVSGFMANLISRAGRQSKIVNLNVTGLIRTACVNNQCLPEVADVFEAMAATLEHLGCSFDFAEEARNNLRFLTVSDRWSTTDGILCSSDLPDFADERMRHAFAPEESRLAAAYGIPAVTFFVRCREKMKAPTSTLAKWILECRDLPRKHAALAYIADGELSGPVAELVRDRAWLADISPRSALLSDFDQRQRDLILRALVPKENIAKSWERESEKNDDPPATLQGSKALQAISAWWKTKGIEQLKAFDHEFWPAEIPRQFDSICDNRLSWMTLFGIGLMQRHGRVRDQQNRGFIDMMHSKRWWKVFSEVDPRADGQAWLDVLREYGKPQIQDEKYSMWMDNFPRLYRIASWFDVYTQVFLGLDYREKAQTAEYLSPSADPVMSGSGSHAPTMRGSLRLGQHVVVRELLRCGVIQSDAAKALAYKPGSSVKRLLTSIGFGLEFQSEQIYDILQESLGDDATFGGAYDIPLIIFSRNSDLQRRILGAPVPNVDEFDDQ